MQSHNTGPEAFGHGCMCDDCEELTPWDMSAVIVNRTDVYCSPDCAWKGEAGDPETIALHDPQYHAERPENVGKDAVDVWREVESRGDFSRALASFTMWHTGPFRASVD